MNIPKYDVVRLSPDDARRVNLKIQKQFDELVTTLNIAQSAANTIAGKCLCEAYECLSQHTLFRNPHIRRYANLAKEKYYSYEKVHASDWGERYQMFLDHLDSVEEIINPHLQILYFAVKRVLDKHNQPDTELRSKLEVAYVMIELSCRIFDNLLRKAEERANRNFTKYLKPARLTGCLTFWDNVVNSICVTRKGEPDIDLNADADCKLALKVIDTKLSDADFLGKAAYSSLKLNPDVVEKYCKNDFKSLEEKYEK